MKKTLLLLQTLLVYLLLFQSQRANSQINYSVDFESAGHGWSDNGFGLDNELPCAGLACLGGFTYFEPEGGGYNESYSISPVISGSNGLMATLNFDYKILNWSGEGAPDSPNWGTLTVYYAESPGGPWTLIETIFPGNHEISTECALRSTTFYPPAGDIYVMIHALPNMAGEEYNEVYPYIDDIVIYQDSSVTCSGTPSASSAVAESLSVCSEEEVTISLEPAYAESGLIFQWQMSADGINFTDVPAGGSLSTYTGPQETSRWYRAIITCENNGEPITSATVYIESIISNQPIADSPQIFEGEPGFTVISLYEDVEVDAEGIIIWYATEEGAEDGENPIDVNDMVSAGIYYVTQTIDGCESDPATVEVQMVLDAKDFAADTFTYYPNPVKDVLTLFYTQAITHVEVFNMLGQKVLEAAPGQDLARVDLSSLANAAYTVKVSVGEASKTIRVIKQ